VGFKLFKKSDGASDNFGRVLATLSLIISLASAAFSFWQWKAAEKEKAIDSAIQMSTDEAKDGGLAQLKKAYIDFMDHRNFSFENATMAANFIIHLDYLAQLTNESLLNERYLSLEIKCEMIGNYRLIYVTKRFNAGVDSAFLPKPKDVKNLAEFYKRHSADDCLISGN
jgi:hypothetical protein